MGIQSNGIDWLRMQAEGPNERPPYRPSARNNGIKRGGDRKSVGPRNVHDPAVINPPCEQISEREHHTGTDGDEENQEFRGT